VNPTAALLGVPWDEILRAHAAHHAGLTLVHLDAHPDLYDVFEGDRLSHACPTRPLRLS
jgi:arginase family enzyme